jgi:hypothetical protein
LQAKCSTLPRPPTVASIAPDLPLIKPERQAAFVRDWYAKNEPDWSKLKPDEQGRLIADRVTKYGKPIFTSQGFKLPVDIDAIRKDPDFIKASPEEKLARLKRIFTANDPDFAKATAAEQEAGLRKLFPEADEHLVPTCEACDPETLDFFNCELVGIRLEIQQEYRSSKKGWEDVEFWAVLVGVLFSVPRAWYFLLGRIAEISAAIRGS